MGQCALLIMFKNLTIYRIIAGWPVDHALLDATLRDAHFTGCAASQDKSVGWVEPRGHAHGPMVEIINGQWLLKLAIETKPVPAPVIKRKVQEYSDQMEASAGRKPGKKELREFAEHARMALLPMAFSKQSSAQVWADPAAGLLYTDGGDDAIIWLIKAIDGLVVQTVTRRMPIRSALLMRLFMAALSLARP